MSQELVSIVKGIPTTTSLKVAEVFHKRHDHVIRDIEKLIANCPESFNAPNFGLVDYTDPKGEKRPMYLLTKDGMTLLVMGYTGKEAMKFKLAYISAFNEMEAQLKQNAIPAPESSYTLSTTASRKPLTSLVSTWVTVSGLKHAQCWAQVNAYFQIERISELPDEWIPDALRFVQHQIDTAQAAKAEQKSLPAPFPYDIPEQYKSLTNILQGLHGLINTAMLDQRGYSMGDPSGRKVSDAYCAMTYLAANNLHAACAALTTVKRQFLTA